MTDPSTIALLVSAAVLWAGTLGYLLALQAAALRLPRQAGAPAPEPRPIAVVIPVLNEAAMIRDKLRDLRASDYPAGRARIVVVDGGSSDRTAAIVRGIADADPGIGFLAVESAAGKAALVNAAFRSAPEDIVVVTDADARLDPACLRELVRSLEADPQTAMVGATVRPCSPMPEENAYWWFLNRLWWIEGCVLGAAMVSAAGYAVRRDRWRPLPDDVHCDDAFLAGTMGAAGARVRLCLDARATELRVPRSVAETLRFRIRRGCGYLRELDRIRPQPGSHRGWRLTRGFRRFHIRVAPVLAALVAALATMLLVQGRWVPVAGVAGAFAAGALAVLGPPRTTPAPRSFARWPRRAAAGIGAGMLTWLALLRIGWWPDAARNRGASR